MAYLTAPVLDTACETCVSNGTVFSWVETSGKAKQPQLNPIRATPDPQALRNPRPPQNVKQKTIYNGGGIQLADLQPTALTLPIIYKRYVLSGK